MATSFTTAIRTQIAALEEDPSNFAAEFDRWKAAGERGEYNSFLFGKDGAYTSPKVDSVPNVLRHVHLVPLSDPVARRTWDRQWGRRTRKVSDRALVYASDARYGHLLIFILNEPEAHLVAKMISPDHKRLMMKFAAVASRFIQDGKIII